MATIDDFNKIEMQVGRIIDVGDFPEANKHLYKIKIDFGPLGVRQSAAGLKNFYKKEELIGRQVVAVTNFPPRKIAGFDSECLILAAVEDDGKVILLKPDEDAKEGSVIK